VFCPKRRPFIHYFKTKGKRKAPNGAVLNAAMGLLLPLNARDRGEVPLGQSWGSCTVVASGIVPLCHDWTGVAGLSPHVFAYKYRGRESIKGGSSKKRNKERKQYRLP